MTTVIDATDAILGRLATAAASTVNDGDEVYIINAEQAVVSGDRDEVFDEYRQRRELGSRDHGPTYPKAPERIVTRTIRGMLPDGPDGRDAQDRLTVVTGNPEDRDADDVDVKRARDLKGRNHVTVQAISDNI